MVTAAKPKVGGAISKAPTGTTLPTTANATLDQAFNNLGYISDEGVKRNVDMETETIKAWGGDVVLVLNTGKTETIRFVMLDSTNLHVLKTVFGSANVSGTLTDGIAINSNNSEMESNAYVVDMIESDNTLHRVVVPSGKVSSIGEITYVDNDAVKYDVTVTCQADSSGNTVYDYIKQ